MPAVASPSSAPKGAVRASSFSARFFHSFSRLPEGYVRPSRRVRLPSPYGIYTCNFNGLKGASTLKVSSRSSVSATASLSGSFSAACAVDKPKRA